MGDLSKKLMAKAKPDANGRRSDMAKDDDLRPDDANALKKLQAAAKKQGCLLTSGGKGGLSPALVWHVFRRDADDDGIFRCKVCGETGTEENGGLGVHHKYQHIAAPKERRKGELANASGRRNDPNQMIVICAKDHDKVHERDREENPGGEDADEARRNGDDDEEN